MLVQLPDEDAWVQAGDVQYFISANWTGEHSIVSECGWWLGTVSIVQEDGARHIEWLQAYSLQLDTEEA